MNASKFAASGATIVLAAIGGAAVFALTAAPHARLNLVRPGRPRCRCPRSSSRSSPPQRRTGPDPKPVYEGAKASVARDQGR